MIKALKRIIIEGKEYFFDERLKELRGCEDLETIEVDTNETKTNI